MSNQSAYLNPPERSWTGLKVGWYIGVSVLPGKESKNDLLSCVLHNASVASGFGSVFKAMTTSAEIELRLDEQWPAAGLSLLAIAVVLGAATLFGP
jgi:hypothetical protein